MGRPKEAPPAKLVAAIMHHPDNDPGIVLDRLTSRYGAVDLRGQAFEFTSSDYYAPEMGAGLVKFFLSFSRLVPQDSLAAVKRHSNAVEVETSREGRRIFNVDPGLVTTSSLILATTKGYAHRIYMGEGIYQEVTLVYRRGSFQPQPWTYPDYAQPSALEFFASVRERCRAQLANDEVRHA